MTEYKTFAKVLENRAANMRRELTRTEQIVKDRLDAMHAEYQMQVPVGMYIVDFVLRGKVALEIDGASHKGREAYDKRRDDFLRRMGFKVVRVKASRAATFWLSRFAKPPKNPDNPNLKVQKKRRKKLNKRLRRAEKKTREIFAWSRCREYQEEIERDYARLTG